MYNERTLNKKGANMGMYTELQGTIKFKNATIARLFVGDDNWRGLTTLVPEVGEFEDFARSHCIPYGSGDGVTYQGGCVVKFHTELKNYSSTIEKFYEMLPFLADDWILEKKYEELSYWELFTPTISDVRVNGCNSIEAEWYGKPVERVEYPAVDVFDLNNLRGC